MTDTNPPALWWSPTEHMLFRTSPDAPERAWFAAAGLPADAVRLAPQDRELGAGVSGLRAENMRLRAEIADHVRVRTEIGDILDKALGGYEDGTESGAGWIVRDVGLLARESAHARRELVAVREQHSASVQVLAAHLEAVRAGQLRCDHPEHDALPAVDGGGEKTLAELRAALVAPVRPAPIEPWCEEHGHPAARCSYCDTNGRIDEARPAPSPQENSEGQRMSDHRDLTNRLPDRFLIGKVRGEWPLYAFTTESQAVTFLQEGDRGTRRVWWVTWGSLEEMELVEPTPARLQPREASE